MSSIIKITSSTPMPPDLAKKIGVGGVNEIIDVFWKGYRGLKSDTSFVVNGMKKLFASGIQGIELHQLLLTDFALSTNMQITQ